MCTAAREVTGEVSRVVCRVVLAPKALTFERELDTTAPSARGEGSGAARGS